jgi:hypothetical protein
MVKGGDSLQGERYRWKWRNKERTNALLGNVLVGEMGGLLGRKLELMIINQTKVDLEQQLIDAYFTTMPRFNQ